MSLILDDAIGGVTRGLTITTTHQQGVLANESASVTSITSGSQTSVVTDGVATIHGAYGTLTMHADGSYSYVAHSNIAMLSYGIVRDAFSFEAQNAQGDVDTAALTITVVQVGMRYVSGTEGGTLNISGKGIVVVDASLGNQVVKVGNVDAVIIGGDGNTITAGNKDVTVIESTNSSIQLGNGSNTLLVGDGNTIKLGNGDSTVVGGDGNTISAGNGDYTITAGSDTTFTAGNGDSHVVVGDGSSVKTGNGSSDITVGSHSSVKVGNGANDITGGDCVIVIAGKNKSTVDVGDNSTVTVGGDHAPVVTAGAPSATLVEAGTTTSGVSSSLVTLTKSDANGAAVTYDTTGWDALTATRHQKTGTYGTAVLDTAANTLAYSLDDAHQTTNALAADAAVTDAFQVRVKESSGILTGSTSVSFSILGSNDAPVITTAAGADAGAVIEAGNLDDGSVVAGNSDASGVLTASDVDAGATAAWTGSATGKYGTFAISSAGAWTYTLLNSDADTNALREGASDTDIFSATVTDDHGATASQLVTITVTGTNDVPVASAAMVAVAEDATIIGSVSATDADAGEAATLSYALVNAAPAGLTFNADGSYAFDASSYDSLKVGEPLVLTAAFTATDSNGAVSTAANLVITVTGTNDVPVASAAVAAVAEDATITGNVNATDADGSETATLTYELVEAAPMGLIFNADGSYAFDASSYDSLKVGEPLVLTAAFTATDENGAVSSAADLVITVTGTIDVPVASAAVAAVVEDATITGSVSATDADVGETETLSYALVEAAPAGLTFNAYGSYAFDASSYDSLKVGNSLVLTAAFAATDENGAVSEAANLVITVTGGNDVPVASAAVAEIAEDAIIAGSVAATDADAGETATLTYALVDAAPAGLIFNADGSYAFDASSYDSLSVGEPLVLTAAFTATDENGAISTSANLVITVTGTNDVPVASAAVAAVGEDATITGSVSATDADAGEAATLTYALVEAAPVGLTFNADGTYSFDASSYDSLKVGEPLVLTAAFTATDSNGAVSTAANLVITVTGTNDVPVASAAVAAVAEDATITGNVNATDADGSETATLTYALVEAAPMGLTFNADGTYSFDASSYDSLNVGEPLVLTAAFTATDENGAVSSAANLVITITGTNDVPVASAVVPAVAEDAMISGSVSATDADAGETATLTYALVNASPVGLNFNADGSYTFDASSYDSLTVGEQLMLTAAFTAADANDAVSAPANLVITITGTNDVPVASAAVAEAIENATIGGTVAATDVDFGETATLTYALVNTAPAGLTFNADGSYTFDASSYDSLNIGEPLVLTAAFSAIDENGAGSSAANLVITIIGTNDVPVASAAVAAVAEDGAITGNVAAVDADADETTTLTYALVDAAPTGFTFNADGSYTFDASSYDSLKVGEPLVLTAAFTATDENGAISDSAHLVITVTGTNDVPVASAAVAEVAEDATINGNVSATDADAGEMATLTYALVDAAPTGLTFSADGSYTFDASSYDSLTVGEQLILTAAFSATDENDAVFEPANLVITITGTNDVPVASAAVAAVAEEATISGSVAATDADSGGTATLTYALVNAAPAGLTFNADGSYSFDASSYDSLTVGEPLALTAAFTATDENGVVSAAANLVITVTGTNDVPVASAAVVAVAEEATISGSVSATDADAGETATLSYALLAAAPAGLTFNADGSYTFDAASYDGLSVDESLVLTAAFTAADENGAVSAAANLVITISGTNDEVTITGTVQGGLVVEDANDTVAPDDALSVAGTVTFDDADLVDVHTATFAQAAGGTSLGVFALGSVIEESTTRSGSVGWSYTLSAGAGNYLAAGESVTETYAVSVADVSGSSAGQDVLITLTGTNDAVVITAQDVTGAVVEPGTPAGNLTDSGTIAFTDADLADVHLVSASGTPIGSALGTLTAVKNSDTTGSGSGGQLTWTYSVASSAVEYLAKDQTKVESFTITLDDQKGSLITRRINVTITGANDAPVAFDDVLSTNEDTALVVSAATLLGNDTDVDAGDTKTLISVQSPSNGTVSLAGGNVTFTPGANYNGPGSFAYTVRDAAGAQSTGTVNIAVNAVNDAPVIGTNVLVNGSFETQPQNTIVALGAGSTALPGWTVTGNSIDVVPSIYWQAPDGKQVLDLSGNNAGGVRQTFATVAGTEYAVNFQLAGNPDTPASPIKNLQVSTGGAPLSYTFDTTGRSGANMDYVQKSFTFIATAATTNLSFASLNNSDAGPVLDDVRVVPTGFATNEDTAYTLAPNGVSDVDAGTNPLAATLSVAHGALTLASIAGLANVVGAGTGTLSFTGAQAAINAALTGVTYTPHANYDGTDSLVVTMNDQGNTGADPGLTDGAAAEQDIQTFTIIVNSVNDAPVNAVPGMQTTNEDTSLSITGLSVSDVDAGSMAIVTTLSVAQGTLTVDSAGGASVVGSGTGTVSLTGSQAQINITLAAANNVVYAGALNFSGNDLLTVTSVDAGATGMDPGATGGPTAEQDIDTVAISVTAVNDAPVNSVPGPQAVSINTNLPIAGLSVSDADAGDASITTTLEAAHGTLSVAAVAGGAAVTNSGSSAVTLTGSQTQINTTLAGAENVVYEAVMNYSGPDALTITTTDGGATGVDGSAAEQDIDTVAINVVGPIYFYQNTGSSGADAADYVGQNGGNAASVWNGAFVSGDLAADVLRGYADARGGSGGYGTFGAYGFAGAGPISNGDIYAYSYEQHYYRYGDASSGGSGGSGGGGGGAYSQLYGDALLGRSGADILIFSAQALGSTGGHGGNGGVGGSTGGNSHYDYYAVFQLSDGRYYDRYFDTFGGYGGWGGWGGTGGLGGYGQILIEGNQALGGGADDTILLSGAATGGGGGGGGNGGMGASGAGAGGGGYGGYGGNGGDALSALTSNTVLGDDGNDAIRLVATALGGAAGAGGSGASPGYGETYYAEHDYSDGSNSTAEYRYYGYAGAGGFGGVGGDAYVNISRNYVHGGNGNDIISIEAAVDVGAGGLGGGGGGTGQSYDYWSGNSYYYAASGSGGGPGGAGANGEYFVVIEGNNLQGGAGDDVVKLAISIMDGTGFVTVAGNSVGGGTGSDTLDLSLLGQAVAVDLSAGSWVVGSGYNTVTGIEKVIGSAVADDLVGSASNDVLQGGGGSDTLSGGGGSDTFAYTALSDGGPTGDVIADFSAGPGGDVLDVRDVLSTFTGITSGTHANAFTGGFLRFTPSGSNTLVEVDSDGGANSLVTLATLSNALLHQTDMANYVL